MQARDFEIHVCSALASIRVRDDVRTLDTDADDRIHVKAYRSKPGDGELVVVVEGGTQRPRRMLFFGEHPWFASSSHAVNTVTPKRTNVVIARPLCSHRRGLSVARGPTPARTRRTTSGPVRTWGPRRENGLGARSRWGDRLGEWAAHRSSSHQRMSALSCRCAADGLPPATP